MRAKHNRVLPDQQAGKLWAWVMTSAALGCVRFGVPAFTRYDKLDVMFAAFITVALVAEALRLR